MFQHPAWVIAQLLFWVGLHPLLRIVVYPQWELKPFIHGMEVMSAVMLVLQVLSVSALRPRPWSGLRMKDSWRAVALLPVIWLVNSLVLWLVLEFQLIQDPIMEPLYDSQHFIRRYPMSWTALSFILSAVLEEIFFRAWLPDFLAKRVRKSLAIGVSALLFALAHYSLHTHAQSMLAWLLFAFSLSYVRSFHGLGAAIGVHLLNNILAFCSQVYAVNLFAELSSRRDLQYLVLLLLMIGVFLVGRDILRAVDKGADAPQDPYSLP